MDPAAKRSLTAALKKAAAKLVDQAARKATKEAAAVAGTRATRQSQKTKPLAEPPAGQEAGPKPLKMHAKNVGSRAYHKKLVSCRKEGMPEEACLQTSSQEANVFEDEADLD